MANKYIFSIIFIICSDLLISSNGSPLMGGNVEPAEDNEFPFVVSLGYFVASKRSERYLNHFCGGSLITSRHVLTAAHCLEKEDPRNLAVTVGNVDLNEGKIYNVESWISFNKWIMKNNYMPEFPSNDIAVVTLSNNVTHIEPALRSNLSDTEIYKKKVLVAGWGQLTNGLKPQFLQKASLRVLTPEKCKRNVFKLFGTLKLVPPNHYCTAAKLPVILGCGDSGGPLLLKDTKEIVGVNQASCDSHTDRYATNIHVKVNYFKAFIDDASKE